MDRVTPLQFRKDLEALLESFVSSARCLAENYILASGGQKLIDPRLHVTDREQDVLALAVELKYNKEIADTLHITTRTVKFHMTNLLAKYGVQNRIALRSKVLLYGGYIHGNKTLNTR